MKKLILILTVTLITTTILLTHSDAASPFPPWLQSLTGSDIPDGVDDQEGSFVSKTVRFIYDVATDGGDAAAQPLGVFLPKNTVITRSSFQIVTPFTSGASGGGTTALHCEDANNIKTATDITGESDNAMVEGASTGAASAYVRGIAAPCEITATVAGTAHTAGKLIGWINYYIGE